MQIPLIPLKATPVASMGDGGHKVVTQQRKVIKQAIQQSAALLRGVNTLVEAKALANFKPFAKLALAYSDYDAFNKRGRANHCREFLDTLRIQDPDFFNSTQQTRKTSYRQTRLRGLTRVHCWSRLCFEERASHPCRM
jgi:hypothetical protein